MSRQMHSLFALSIIATAAITAERFVTGAGVAATAAGNALGVARSDAAIGESTTVDTLGTAIVVAGAAIAANAAVEVGATGKAVLLAAGKCVGRLAPGSVALADGDRVEVILIPN